MAAFRIAQRHGLLNRQRVKVRRDLKDMGFFYISFIGAVIVVAVGFVYLTSRLMVVDMGYEISRLNEIRKSEEEKNKRLRFELARFKSPERLESLSKEMGLGYPKKEQIMHIKQE